MTVHEQINAAVEARGKLVAEAREVDEQIRNGSFAGSEAEGTKRFEEIMAKAEAKAEEVKRLKAVRDAEASLEESAAEHRAARADVAKGRNVDPEKVEAAERADEAEVFFRAMAYGAQTLSADERQILQRAQATTPDGAGGFTVPTDTSAAIEEAEKYYNAVALVARPMPTATGNDIVVPTLNETAV